MIDHVELDQARQLLRYAAAGLTRPQRRAIACMINGVTQREQERRQNLNRGHVQRAQTSGLRIMRERLQALGIRSSSQLVSEFPNGASMYGV